MVRQFETLKAYTGKYFDYYIIMYTKNPILTNICNENLDSLLPFYFL